ncbi:MAG TPA: ABC transporter permease [Candidatus Agrococcus pullicola]|uniref:Transport permease protein n=1 Tax=Candidatus Agrococcus pullicola TaxID=2838429 RepID=A0A9D1YX37_9MICO|nr:ABC transporter permease [Candidatus Agrococcus pullicola]
MATVKRTRTRDNTWQLLQALASRDVKGQYKRTFLGRTWSLINPLAQIAIYWVVFGLLFRATPAPGINSGMEIYGLWLAVGIIVWSYLSGTINDCMTSYISFSGLLKKVYLPRWTLPMSRVLSRTYTFLTELLVLAVICGVFGGWEVLLRLIMLVPLVLLTALFAFGLGLLLAVSTVYFRDIEHFWGILTRVWFYGSGVMFPLGIVQSAQEELVERGWTFFGTEIPLVTLFQLNPAFEILTAFRRVLYDFAWPELSSILIIAGWGVVLTALAVFVYNRHQARIVEEL